MHYGVKGMHWGVRRYQNDDGTLTDAGKAHYGGQIRKIRAKNTKLESKYTKAHNKASKYFLKSAKAESKGNTEKYMKYKKKSAKLESDASKINVKISKNKQKIQKISKKLDSIKKKKIKDLQNNVQKAPKTDRAVKFLEKNGDKIMTKVLNSEKMNNRLNAIDQMMKKSKYAEEYERAKKGSEQIQKDYNLPTYEEMRVKAAKKPSTNLIRGGRAVTIKQPKTISSQDRIDNAYKKAESIQVGYGAGSVDMSHPAVRWAINDAKRKGSVDPEGFIKREGEPPRHDDWAHVILDYEKSKKKK